MNEKEKLPSMKDFNDMDTDGKFSTLFRFALNQELTLGAIKSEISDIKTEISDIKSLLNQILGFLQITHVESADD